ncbi:MmpS family transport accessory protein [Mycobacterium ulcerans]|nr:MmpS family transport accessory protein [Mycobacterium ulcerans]MEB3903468.1 MmpS family transport accessory protein [Mycobacterium ulcerans]MEB3907608.1 MmpS family transport accessory protein [Mycobacterium ulcerans]MEB3917903.1 MmpS family transport accessory protein [Mycobacterium ulcerans]MEB3921987.1 MmpS family transport accessory protein [Mycobacterium ulcerans]MEB3926119.1 MmpS family transport accessory protein [Mycobacterium ulcerans]
MLSLFRRMWVPIVMVLVAIVGASVVMRLHGVFGSHRYVPDAGNSDAIVAFNPKYVRYEVFGPPGTVVTVNYLDAQAEPHEVANAAIPWSLTIVTTLTSVVAHLVAQGNSATLSCRITVNGVVRAERTADAHDAATSCPVKSA